MSDELDLLIADGVIDEVLSRIKSGKEANISLVRRGDDLIAAKVYKDRATRSFKNNTEYKEGRKVRNSRTQRAMDSGGRFGKDAAEQAWKSAEADALYRLVGSGVRIPAPIMFYEGVLLMELVRDAEGRAAPRLIDVSIERDAALGVYADLCAQIISMLCCDLIHGDLSPYNILASADGPTIIDFPQVISAVHNSRAEYFFLRDFDNVVRFIAGFDPSLAVHTADGRAIWRAYVSRELTPQFVPPPPPPPRPTRGPDRRSRPDDRGRAPQRAFDNRGPQNGRGPQNQHPQGPRNDQRPEGPRNDQRPQAPRPQGPSQQGPRIDQRPQGPRPDQRPDQRTDQRTDQRPQAPRSDRNDQRPQGQRPQGQRPQGPRRPDQRTDQRAQGPQGPRRDWADRQPPGRPPDPRDAVARPRTPEPPRPPAPMRRGPPEPRPGWSEARPGSAPPPPSRGGRRRPKRRF